MRRVVAVVYPGIQSLDVAGPVEVFAAAGAYSIELAGPTAGPVVANSGLVLHADTAIADVRGRIDTLLVAGGEGTRDIVTDARFIAHVRRLAHQSRRVTSVCTGAFLLAQAGLLRDRRATTHWNSCADLAQFFPDVDVDPDAIFVRDGNVW